MRGFAFCNELFGDLPLGETLSRLAAVGYDGVELDARSLVGLDPGSLAARCQESGIAVAGLHWLLAGTRGLHLAHPSAKVRRATLCHLQALAAVCTQLGGRVMVLGGGESRRVLPGVSLFQALGYAEEVLRALGDDLLAKGVLLGLEPLEPRHDNLLNSAEAAAELVDRIGCPNLGLALDARAMETETRPREDLVAAYSRYLVHVHVSDASTAGPGMGSTDLRPMLDALMAASYQGWISVEAFDPTPSPDVVARRSLEYLRCLWTDNPTRLSALKVQEVLLP